MLSEDPDIARTPPDREAVTRLLQRVCRQENVAGELTAWIYDDLHRLASTLLRRERPGHTLQATALVHEAWLRLVDIAALTGTDPEAARQRFLGFAATAMRRILVEHARARLRHKRSGGAEREALVDLAGTVAFDPAELLDLDAAVELLAQQRPRAGRIAELRLYGGMSTAEAAAAADVSLTVAKAEWAIAQALLARWLRGAQEGADHAV